MTKISELESSDREAIEDELESKATELGLDTYDSYSKKGEMKVLSDMIGICASCKSLSYCSTEFGNVFATCGHFEMRLSGQNRITECNCHNQRGVLSLNEMQSIATLIDPDKEPSIKGFISHDPKLRKRKKIEKRLIKDFKFKRKP